MQQIGFDGALRLMNAAAMAWQKNIVAAIE